MKISNQSETAMNRKIAFVFFALIWGSGFAQAQITKPGETGKTYYDSAFTKVCEIFHHDVRYIFIDDTLRKEKVFKGRIIIRNGPYLSYYPDGKLESSGFYQNDEKDSTWLYYNPKGELIKTEKYRNNYLIE